MTEKAEAKVKLGEITYCYEGVCLTHENMMEMVQGGVPMIEIEGVLYLPIAFVGDKKGLVH